MTPKSKTTITATFHDGHREEFTFNEYLKWRDWQGRPVPEDDRAEHLTWLLLDGNDIGRRDVWREIHAFLRDQPHLKVA
jgi:hypothetical protein